ncbi:ATP-binding protein [Solirubrobacter phytolaccae]|uniref:Sensor-like histidine kinase SenX3 n=1 Tax=Solirubrobacter phytolaccae TaxID=1404360 RepID=A0A9X3N8Z2_9ACTN|nr:ATP-binding protein [Solirubrobacter phytolaccae]MDA0180457.1 ATP-binding protein [Solirubrobacter phytolaccae]
MVGGYRANVANAATLESDRLSALHALNILDTPSEARFDRLTRIASAALDAPIATVTLVDEHRQWFKSCVGLDGREDDRDVSFCSVAIEKPEPLLIPDTLLDPRVAHMRVVTDEPFLRSYAGIPIATATGFRVGTVCIADTRPRTFSAADVGLLEDLARIAEDELNHKELSEALASWRESEQRFRAVFHDSTIGMTMVNGEGRLVEANLAFAAMVNIPPAELRGIPIMTLTHPADRDNDNIKELFTGEIDRYRREKRYVRPDGTWFWGALTASMLRDREGRPDVSIGMIEDITERKEVERMKDELVSIVGHELRTPLTSIRGSLGLLEAGIAGELPAEAADMVAIARQNTERLSRLVDETLDLERLQAGRVELNVRSVTPPELLQSTAQVVQRVADDAGIELVWEAPADLQLFVDPDRIVQALVNLIGNAIKFSPEGSSVRTIVKAHGSEALFTVRDQGRGIPLDQLDAIFERFRQVDASDHREKGGTGLGLPISRAIIEQHAGRIWAESVPGEGSTFRITLPLPLAKPPIAVYDRRAPRREELARAARRIGRRVLTFSDPETLAEADGFVLVLVAGAGLEDVDPGVPVIRIEGEDVDAAVVEALK